MRWDTSGTGSGGGLPSRRRRRSLRAGPVAAAAAAMGDPRGGGEREGLYVGSVDLTLEVWVGQPHHQVLPLYAKWRHFGL